LKGNKEAFKIIGTAVLAVCALNPQLSFIAVGTGVTGIVIKSITDIFDYYVSE